MSNRSLIEINHDFCGDLGPELVVYLQRYLRSASREAAETLERFGIRVIGMRHHSGNFILDGEPDGFPVQYLPRPQSEAEPSAGSLPPYEPSPQPTTAIGEGE